jgi:hypothetical protein
MPPLLTWNVAQTIVDIFFWVGFTCVFTLHEILFVPTHGFVVTLQLLLLFVTNKKDWMKGG